MKSPLYYQVLMALARPIWQKKVQKNPYHADTRAEIAMRFLGVVNANFKRSCVWVHTVSLGEMNTAAPFIRELLAHYDVYLTYNTKTAYARVGVLFCDEIKRHQLSHGFMPMDKIDIMSRFLDDLKPRVAVFVETELWANALYLARGRGIKTALINARLSQKSFKGYARFGKMSQSMMANLDLIIAQDELSATRFKQLGANNIAVLPSLKWQPPPMRAPKFVRDGAQDDGLARAPVWIAASTHEGEEQICLDAHATILAHYPDARLVIVPRHPERFDGVYDLCARYFKTVRRSDLTAINADTWRTPVLLGDSMGELLDYYCLADVAFVGGSLVDIGGHNPIEPAALGRYVLMGGCHESCHDVVSILKSHGVLGIVSAQDLAHKVMVAFGALMDSKKIMQIVQIYANAYKRQANRVLDLL